MQYFDPQEVNPNDFSLHLFDQNQIQTEKAQAIKQQATEINKIFKHAQTLIHENHQLINKNHRKRETFKKFVNSSDGNGISNRIRQIGQTFSTITKWCQQKNNEKSEEMMKMKNENQFNKTQYEVEIEKQEDYQKLINKMKAEIEKLREGNSQKEEDLTKIKLANKKLCQYVSNKKLSLKDFQLRNQEKDIFKQMKKRQSNQANVKVNYQENYMKLLEYFQIRNQEINQIKNKHEQTIEKLKKSIIILREERTQKQQLLESTKLKSHLMTNLQQKLKQCKQRLEELDRRKDGQISYKIQERLDRIVQKLRREEKGIDHLIKKVLRIIQENADNASLEIIEQLINEPALHDLE